MTFRRAALIYNPVSGRRQSRRQGKVEAARRILEKWIEQVDLVATTKPGDVVRLTKQALASGADLIAVGGGDGSLNEAVCALAGSEAPLLALPSGTANLLAEQAGIPVDVEKAAALLPGLTSYSVPVGLVRFEQPKPDARHFLLLCGVGVDAQIVYHLNTRLKAYLGEGAYWLGSIEQLQRKFDPFEVRIGDEVHEATFALVSKSRLYGGRLVITPRAHLFSERFEVALFRGESPLRYVGYLARMATGGLDGVTGVTFHRANRVEFLALEAKPIYVEVDGEPAGRLPATVEMATEKVRLLLPPEYAERFMGKGDPEVSYSRSAP